MRKIKLFLSLLMVMLLSVGNVWATTYKLTKVTSVEAGKLYVFERNSHVFNNTSSSSALQTTATYNTSGLEGTESYVWTLESATGGFYLKNVSLASNQYLNNASKTTVSFGAASSIWTIAFTGEVALISNTSNSNRFLGDAGKDSPNNTYKAYATGNLNDYQHDITVYVLDEEGSTPPTPAKTLVSVAVSGAPTKTSYYAGDNFDPAGLTVTGTYSDASTAPITSGITWAYDPSQELALNQTSIGVTATVSEIASPKFNVTGLTVSAASAASNWQVTAPSDLATGDVVVLTMLKNSVYYAAPNNGSGAPAATVVAVANSKLSNSPAETLQWTVTVVEEGVYQFSKGTNYLKCTDTNNGVRVGAVGTDEYNTFDINTTNAKQYLHTTATMTSATNGRFLGIYNTQDWRCYTSVNNNIKDGSLVIFREPASSKENAGLAYAAADAQKLVKVGGSLVAPTLSNENNLTVTYASSDADVVAVDENTGALTIKAVAGKAVITASSEETSIYKAGSASYTIYVAEQAGTAEDPLTEASAKALIDLGCTANAHVAGTVASQDATYYTVTLSDGFKFWNVKDLGNQDFTSAYLVAGDEVTAYGQLTKYNSNYELATGCYLTAYTEHTTPKTPIVSDIDNPITVAAAIGYIDDPVTYDLSSDVWVRGVVTYIGQTNGQSPKLYIDVKDANEDNTFRFFDYTVNSSITQTPQVNDILIATGKLDKYNTTYELNVCEVVYLERPEVAVTSVELDQNAASIEVNETVTLHATINPDNASNKSITWTVESGNDKASVADGVVTGLVAGEAVIRAASTADPTKYAECTVTVTAVDPTKHVVTFDATVDMGESPLSKSNITMSSSNGVLNNGTEYRLYKSSTTTFECSVGNITKIEFTGVSGNPVSGFGDPEEGTLVTDGNDGVWTGNAASVSFIASGAQVRATEIKVTYKEDSRAEAGLAWDPSDDIELTVGDAFTAPTLLNPNNIDDAEITIESSNTGLATVTAGEVALVADATGEATITATFAGNDDYKPATVSYNITVNAAAPTPLTDYYEKVTSGAVAEGTYLIVYEAGNVAFNGGLATLDAENNTIDVEITNDNKIGVTQATADATFYIDPTAGTIQAANGKYIGVTSNSNGLKTSDNADAYSHNFSIDGDGNAVIAPNFEGSTMSLRYNAASNQARFRYYKDNGQQAIQLYKLANEVIKPEAGLAWDPADDIEITVGDALTAPTLLNPNNINAAEITIASSNTNVATINNGEVELVADATGTTTITATFAGNDNFKPATVSYKIKVNPAHSIYVSPSLNVNFGSVAKNASVDDKVITVTLTGVDAATAILEGAGASAFEFTPAALTASGDITISASSATAGTFAATLTISDDAGEATSRVVNLSLTVVDPATVETAISTSTKWVAAVAADLVDGAEVLITGVKDEVTYAMGEQKSTNRAAYVATIDGEGVLTPGEGTMAFTLVAQEGGTFALRTSNGQYLYAAKNDANHLKTQDEVDINAKWTLTTTSAVAEGSSNRNIMRFNGGSSKLFSCYNSGQEDIKFYVPKPVVTYVAQIGETMYESLPAAVAAAQDGQTVELLMDVAAGPGVMITTAEHKQIIIDFGNHTYCANSPAVGSAGTQNQAFHFEKGCNITLQNGTITSSGNEIIMLIQNYGDLTLKNITLIGNNLPGTHRYVLSNNCGNVVIGEGTTITAKEGDVAFDVCVTNYYPEGTQVTVEDGATITGIVEYDVWGTIPADNKATLTIEGGNFDITWNVEPALAEDAKGNINVEGGTFNAEVPADYCAHGYIPKDNGNGQYGVYYAGYYERGSLTPGNYATICLPYAGKISGASLFDIEYYENSTLYLLEVEGNEMVAGRPYIFLPSVEKIEVIYTDIVGAEAGTYNGLVGSLSLVAEVITPNDGNYILYNNQYYFVNSEAYVGANRAYIHMDGVPTQPSQQQGAPRRRVAMTVNGEQVATGIDALNASDKPVKVIIDGKMYILRGEKMFDATGRLVK